MAHLERDADPAGTLAACWQETLESLQRQMTQATFDTWLRGTWLIGQTNGTLRIGVQSEQAKEWLDNRLRETVQRTLAIVIGEAVAVEFVVAQPSASRGREAGEQGSPSTLRPGSGEPSLRTGGGREAKITPAPSHPGSPAPPLEFGLTLAQQTQFHAIKMEMGRWLPELQYDNLFWSPYLDKAYSFYRHLLTHWTKNLRKKDLSQLDMEQAENHWTPPFRLSYRKATQWLGKRNHKVIPGGVYECHQSDIHRRLNQALGHCCQAHTPHDWHAEPEGGGRCYYWRPGLLHKLYDEHLLAIDISGSQRATVQVWRNLPLLTPHQVNQLNPFLQEEHDRWLERHGHLFELTLEEWLTISQTSLVPHLPEYERRQLQGHPPANPFLQPCGGTRSDGAEPEKCNHVVANSPEGD